MNAHSQNVFRFFAFLVMASLLLGAAIVGFTLYERLALGVIRLGTGDAPSSAPYYLVRLTLLVLLVMAAIGGMYRRCDDGTVLHKRSLSSGKRQAVYGVLAVAVACVSLFVIDPAAFHRMALEDGPVEWASALLPLAGSLAFVYAFWLVLRSERRDARHRVALAFMAFFAVVLFVIGMEEISWMQRVFNVSTPSLFNGNEQNETNLHNMYSSLLFNLVYRTGVFAGLIVLPFLAEIAPSNRLFEWIDDFLPRRFVLAASAPVIGFDYNFWNFSLGPMLLAAALSILVLCARAAHHRGDRRERMMFAVLALFAVVSQATFLALGPHHGHTWVISEYRELFLAAGLAVFAWQATVRLRTRYASASAEADIDAAMIIP